MLKPNRIAPEGYERLPRQYTLLYATPKPQDAEGTLTKTAVGVSLPLWSPLPPVYSPGLTLRLEEGEDVVNADGALDVTDDGTRSVVHELDADLGDTTTRAGTAEDL